MTKQRTELRERARAVAKQVIRPRAATIDQTEEYPWDVVKALTDAGLMGMTVPKAYGGPELSYLDTCIVVEEISQECGVSGRIVVEGNMGAISTVMKYGTERQKKLAAEHVLSGDKLAICITEPDAGSAASEMTTRADRRGDRYVINGKKHWITGGGVSRLHLIFAQVYDAHGSKLGIGGFLAQREQSRGLVVGKREPTMGLRGIPETEILFENLEVPEDMAIVPPGGFKQGFGRLMDAYNSQRIGAATVALGLAEGAYQLALSFVKERHQFGRPIAEFQGLQWMLADMSIQLCAARSLIHRAALTADESEFGFPEPTAAAQAKVFASEMAIKVTTDALQLFGARGYSRNLPLERIARDARMFTIGGGTAQILRTVIASRLLNRKLPQTRTGYTELDEVRVAVRAAG